MDGKREVMMMMMKICCLSHLSWLSVSLSSSLFYFSFSLSVFTGWCEFSGCGVQFSEVSLWNSTEGTETAVYVSNISESSEYINSS